MAQPNDCAESTDETVAWMTERWQGKVEGELGSIRKQIQDLADDMREMRKEIRDDRQQTAASTDHRNQDVETRLRVLEGWQGKAVGVTIGISSMVSFAITMAGVVIAFFAMRR